MLAHLDETLKDIERLNAYVAVQKVRRYQHQLATLGAFCLTSPYSGRELKCAEHWLISLGGSSQRFALPLHLYRFADECDVWIASFQVGFGYPLSALIIDGVYAHYAHNQPAPLQQFNALRQVQQRVDALPTVSPVDDEVEGPSVWIGHPNFAHSMWNELPALRALRDQLGASVKVRSLFEPLGALDGIDRAVALTALRRSHAPFAAPVGGEHLDEDTADWLTAQLPDDPPAPTRSDQSPVIWVAHRVDGRSCTNFGDFLAHFDALCRTIEEPAYILDSFTPPWDYTAPWYSAAQVGFAQRKEEARAIFDALSARLTNDGPPRVFNTANLDIPTAMRWALHADFYISPIGSIQHKVAWLKPIDGVIHGPAAASNIHVARWHGAKSEVARTPAFIPAELVEDVRPSAAHLSSSRNMDYRFTDPARAAKLAFQAFKASRRGA